MALLVHPSVVAKGLFATGCGRWSRNPGCRSGSARAADPSCGRGGRNCPLIQGRTPARFRGVRLTCRRQPQSRTGSHLVGHADSKGAGDPYGVSRSFISAVAAVSGWPALLVRRSPGVAVPARTRTVLQTPPARCAGWWLLRHTGRAAPRGSYRCPRQLRKPRRCRWR
jgi:hypothetical protein